MGGTDQRDWSALPEELLLVAMAAMELPDVVHSGSVCSSWRAAYATFRRLRLATPHQPPCLLYVSGTDAAPSLYSPSADATFRVPCSPPPLHGVAGSAHGWLFAADEAANPYLLNPLTGDRAPLPPVTTLDRVKGSLLDAEGSVVYAVDCAPPYASAADVQHLTAERVREWMYRRVAFSAGGAVVLLVHMPHGELSFARPGDERWAPLPQLRQVCLGYGFMSAVHDDRTGLFYVLRAGGGVHALDLSGPSPVARCVTSMGRSYDAPHTHYLVLAPCGDLLVLTRTLRRSTNDNSCDVAATTDICIDKIDVGRSSIARLPGVGDNVLFLGRNSAACLPAEDCPMLNRNCAYLADDSERLRHPISRRDLGVWNFATGCLQNLTDVWPLSPWLDNPPPIWITPSLY